MLNDLRATGFTCPDGSHFEPNPVPLMWHCRLWEVALSHSQEMAEEGYFSHTDRRGQGPSARANARGISWSWIGENIAAGNEDPADTLQQWKDSTTGHCNAMGDPGYMSVAVGY